MKALMKRLILVLLAGALSLALFACGETPSASTPKKTDPNTPPEDEIPEFDISKYSVIYSNQLNSKATEAAGTVALLLTGSDFNAMVDKVTDPTELEILIGQTNRPESEEALALAKDGGFIIKMIGRKLVINAKDDGAIISAISYFTKLFKAGEVAEDLEYISEPIEKLSIIEGGRSDYNLVYLNGLLTSGGTDGKGELEYQLCTELQEALKTNYSVNLQVHRDNTVKKTEIVVGETSREESEAFISSLDYNEYGFEVVGDRIVVAGTNPTTTRLAVSLLIETLDAFKERDGATVNTYLYSGMRFTRYDKRWNTDIPEYEGGVFDGVHDGGNGALMLSYSETTKDAFNEYCQKLASEGYELYHRNNIEKNLYCTYTHETRGMLHVYFTASESRVRIVSYHDGKYDLPEHLEAYDYESLTATAITGYGISAGMCFIITLADSSFIIIDGGSSDTASTCYNFMKSQNKRPDGKIIVRAWYLTHEHSDHFTMTSAFLKKYGQEVVIEEFWCNPATVDYTHYGDNRNVMWEESFDTYKGYINNDYKWITLHTGMEFYVANLKFEVLFTEEDIFPRRCYSYNDCDLILKMTDTIGGQTVLWTGDLMVRGCEIITNNYENYLKSDILQIPHHGMSVAIDLYKEVRPTVALWPTTEAKMETNYSVSGGIYKESRDFIEAIVSAHLIANQNYTVNLPYKQGDPVTIWKTVK